MKKFILAAMALVAMTFTSCEKAEIEMMETVEMAGDWVTTFSDGAGYEYEIPHGLTFNTAANVPDEIWVSDAGWFWDFQAKVKCNLNTLTFESDGWVENISYDDCQVRITNGKIVKNGMTLPSGRVVDTISYDIEFSDDDPGNVWHATGRRYTGFAEDE